MSTNDEIAEMLLMEYWAAKWKEVEKLIDEDKSSHAVFRDMDIDERLLHPVYALEFDTIIKWFNSPQWSTPNEYYTTTCQYLELLENPMPESLNNNAVHGLVLEDSPPEIDNSIHQSTVPTVKVTGNIHQSSSTKSTKYRDRPPCQQNNVQARPATDAINISETTNVKCETNVMSDRKSPRPAKINRVEEAENVGEKKERLEKAQKATTTLLANTNGNVKVELSFSELEMPTQTKTSFTISEGSDAILLPTADRVLVAIPGYLTMDADKLGLMAKADRLPSHITKYLSCPPKIAHGPDKSVDPKISNTAAASSNIQEYSKKELTAKRKLFHSEPPYLPAEISRSKPDIKIEPKKDTDVLIISNTKAEPISEVEYGKIKWSEVVSERTM